jgi:predicted hydrocarbon binding protein
MIELEVQVLAHTREGLLMDIGRVVSANGFTLQRQRLVPDPHGALLTLVVSGPPRRQRALDDALGGHERVISFEIAPSDGGEMRPHFAASRPVDAAHYVPAAPVDEAVAVPAAAAPVAAVVSAAPIVSAPDTPPAPEPEEFLLPPPAPAAISTPPSTPVLTDEPEFALATPQPPPPSAPAPPPADPFVEIVPLPPDEVAIERLIGDVDVGSARLVAALLQLDRTVAPGAREPTLQRAGQRLGAALAAPSAGASSIPLADAIEQVGLPALRTLVETDAQGSQLHIRQSPLCEEAGHSGCAFFAGLLEGTLGPHVAAHEVSVFNVCCRAWGADECVLAISD